MNLKIFVSSVFNELRSERNALEHVIHSLQELFVGMEYFGSTPTSASESDRRKVLESDIYVGLFGYDYGSIDDRTGKSFTELEYRAAQESKVPCLIYIKDSLENSPQETESDLQLSALKKEMCGRHIVQTFNSAEDLKVKFLVDFINTVRSTLWHKANIDQTSPISAEILHSLSKSLIEEQVNAVGGDKYLSSLYVPREAVEAEIMAFAEYEAKFLARLEKIFPDLIVIAKNYNLLENRENILNEIKALFIEGDNFAECAKKLKLLKQIFFVDEVEAFIRDIISIIQEKDTTRFFASIKKLTMSLKEKSFVDSSKLHEFSESVFEERKKVLIRKITDTTSGGFQEIIRIFPSIEMKSTDASKDAPMANDLIKELDQLIELNFKRCLVLVDKAGTGKTNVLCDISKKLAQKTPLFLLGGYMSISGEYDIDSYIRQQLESQLGGNFSDWLNRTDLGLRNSKKWLLITIDGINENRDFAKLANLFSTFLPRIQEKRVKLILSCRDVLWDFFAPSLSPYSFSNKNVKLNNFDELEWNEAIDIYLSHFNIKVVFGEQAAIALKNPLLMRFFCEAFKNQEAGFIENIRLITVFDLYVKKLADKIALSRNTVGNDEVIGFLTNIANEMWIKRTSAIDLSALEISTRELSEKDSIYNLVLSENIVFDEQTHAYSTKRVIRFVYDEFMEYILARSWVDKIHASSSSDDLIEEIIDYVVESFFTFPTSFGALLFFNKMLVPDRRLVNRAIIRIAQNKDSFSNLRQFATLYAFDSIAVGEIEEELIAALEKFELVARSDIKERLAKVVLKILQANNDHPRIRKIVEKMLEIKAPDLPKPAFTRPVFRSDAGDNSPILDEMYLLPPAQYHYSDEIKLAAIGILVSSNQSSDYELAGSGMSKLGQMEMHNALEALALWDTAEEEQVMRIIADHIKLEHVEFRIYCAWLLRDRYGRKPAELLIKLLTDRDTRVHEYTFKIFSERLIEEELIELILNTIKTTYIISDKKELKIWHLKHFIKLFSVPERFMPDNILEKYGNKIAQALQTLCKTSNESLRLEAYRGLVKYSDFIELGPLISEISQDKSLYIRNLSDQLQKKLEHR